MQAELQAPRAEPFQLKLALGGDSGHETSSMHHIRWIRVYFHPDGENRNPLEVGSFRFQTHGCTPEGESPVCSGDSVHCTISLNEPGTLLIVAYCSLHGFWERELHVQLV